MSFSLSWALISPNRPHFYMAVSSLCSGLRSHATLSPLMIVLDKLLAFKSCTRPATPHREALATSTQGVASQHWGTHCVHLLIILFRLHEPPGYPDAPSLSVFSAKSSSVEPGLPTSSPLQKNTLHSLWLLNWIVQRGKRKRKGKMEV